jgi:hypothetical protein
MSTGISCEVSRIRLHSGYGTTLSIYFGDTTDDNFVNMFRKIEFDYITDGFPRDAFLAVLISLIFVKTHENSSV